MYSFNDIVTDFDIFEEITITEMREKVQILNIRPKYELILITREGTRAKVDHVRYVVSDDTDTLEVHAVEMECPGAFFIGMNDEMFELYRVEKVKL